MLPTCFPQLTNPATLHLYQKMDLYDVTFTNAKSMYHQAFYLLLVLVSFSLLLVLVLLILVISITAILVLLLVPVLVANFGFVSLIMI